MERCLLLLTDKHIYLIQSPQNGHRLLRRIPISALEKISLSRNADNFMVLHINTSVNTKKRVSWVPDKDVATCGPCGKGFGMFRRRHHCRACGMVFCSNCTTFLPQLPDVEPEGKLVKEGERVCGRCEPNISREPLEDLLLSCDRKTEMAAMVMDAVMQGTEKEPSWIVDFVDETVTCRRAQGPSIPVRFIKDEGCEPAECIYEGSGVAVKVASGISATEERERREREQLRARELAKKRKKAAKKRQKLLEAQRAKEEEEAIERRRIKFAQREAEAAEAAAAPEMEEQSREKKLKKKRESKKKKQEEAQAEVPEWQKKAMKRGGD